MKEFHEGFTRLSQASTGVPDRVPFTTQMHEFAMTWCGAPNTRFYSDANVLISGLVKAAEDQAPLTDQEKILIREKKVLAHPTPITGPEIFSQAGWTQTGCTKRDDNTKSEAGNRAIQMIFEA